MYPLYPECPPVLNSSRFIAFPQPHRCWGDSGALDQGLLFLERGWAPRSCHFQETLLQGWKRVGERSSRWMMLISCRVTDRNNLCRLLFHFLPSCTFHNHKAVLCRTLNALYRAKMKRKHHVNFSENSLFPSETHPYKIQYL